MRIVDFSGNHPPCFHFNLNPNINPLCHSPFIYSRALDYGKMDNTILLTLLVSLGLFLILVYSPHSVFDILGDYALFSLSMGLPIILLSALSFFISSKLIDSKKSLILFTAILMGCLIGLLAVESIMSFIIYTLRIPIFNPFSAMLFLGTSSFIVLFALEYVILTKALGFKKNEAARVSVCLAVICNAVVILYFQQILNIWLVHWLDPEVYKLHGYT